jgi:hypothetical protein
MLGTYTDRRSTTHGRQAYVAEDGRKMETRGAESGVDVALRSLDPELNIHSHVASVCM